MNARTLTAAACALVLCACAGKSIVINENFFPNGVVVILADRKVNVTIDDRVIFVNQEPLRVKANDNGHGFDPVTVTFYLKTPGYEFKPEQMTPDPLKWVPKGGSPSFGATSCVFGSDGADKAELQCTFTPTVKKQANLYTLRVCVAGSSDCFASDPSMMN